MSKEFDEFMDGVKNNHPNKDASVFTCKITNCPHFNEVIAQMEDEEPCISCDEHKTTHNVCMDCISNLIKVDAIGFAIWISGSYSYGNILGKWYSHENTDKNYTEEELYLIYKQSIR